MPQKVFFDLDGTLIDVKERYYRVFRSYLDSLDLDSDKINIDLFYENRHKGCFDLELINRIFGIDADLNQYKRFRGDRLEEAEYLNYDSIIADPFSCLRKLKESGFVLCLLSVRKNEANALEQIDRLNLTNLFSSIVFLKPGLENVKLKYLREYASDKDIVIGDGKLEIEAAKELNLISFYVRSGLGTEKEEQKATYAVDNYQDAILKITSE